MIRWAAAVAVLLFLALVPLTGERAKVRVGSKKFTESVILGEMLAHLSRNAGLSAAHFQEMGGTRILYEAPRTGQIDVYPEYTGTITQEILAGRSVVDDDTMRRALAEDGIAISQPLGFNNTYAIGMKKDKARQLGINKISDLARYPDLRFGFSNEFMQRGDGWPPLRQRYGLAHQDVKGMDHDLAYRQLETGGIDAIDVYTTDAKIRKYDLQLLEDDRAYFPLYEAVLLYRLDLKDRAPRLVDSFLRLQGQISAADMVKMNSRTEHAGVTESRTAADFLETTFSLSAQVQEQTVAQRIIKHTMEHLDLVRKSLVPAILVAIPLGILAARLPTLGQGILGAVGIIQTIPALALLVMLIGPVSMLNLGSVGMGSVTAIVALALYSLLPIVRNTYTGLHDIPQGYQESAVALGLPAAARLRLVELPLASRTILAGVKTAAVINVGFATLGALIGAGGYGQPILTGIRLNDMSLILQGAVPAAVMALLVQGLFELSERFFVSKGLRLKGAE